MKQNQLIPEIKRLCNAGEYDAAIKLTNKIEDKVIATKAHILCIEHEQWRLRNEANNKTG